MSKVKLCCFTVNYTHSCIIANNFITNELSNVKVVYINEKTEKNKLKNIVKKFYNKMNDNTFYTEWLNEDITNDYEKENFVFVVSGKTKFIENVNKYLQFNKFNGYIINCYEVFDSSLIMDEILERHDYFINTTGMVKKETFKVV